MQHQRLRLTVTVCDLRLGDNVLLFEGPFGWGTIRRIECEHIDIPIAHLVRPYVHLGSFEYTAGRIPYTGLETLQIFLDGDARRTFKVERQVAEDCEGCDECSPRAEPTPTCSECGEAVHEDDSPGVWLHTADGIDHDRDLDHTALPER
jgi:hypothetical protein